MKESKYAQSGVNIEEGNRAVSLIKKVLRQHIH